MSKKRIETGCGVVISYKDKILLVHQINSIWWRSYSIPKGHQENGENYLEAVLRELKEEVGITIPDELINDSFKNSLYYMADENKNVKRELYYFFLRINSLFEIGMRDERIAKSDLQLEEVDWAGFVSLGEA